VTYIANIDGVAALSASRGKVGEGVRRNGGGVEALAPGAARTASESTSSTATVAEASTTTAESSAATKAAAAAAAAKTTSHSSTEATTLRKASAPGVRGVPVLADFQNSTLPVISVVLLDGIARILCILENDNA
jgi:hypothetical protein